MKKRQRMKLSGSLAIGKRLRPVMPGFTETAWIGCCDGHLNWEEDGTGIARVEVFRTLKAARRGYADVRRVTIHVGEEL